MTFSGEIRVKLQLRAYLVDICRSRCIDMITHEYDAS